MSANIRDKSKPFRSLNVYLLTTIVLFSSFITLLVTSLQLFFEYRKNLDYLENTFIQVRDSYLSSIESSLWSVNQVQLQAVIEGILRLQDMRYIQVTTKEHGIYASAGKKESKYIISRTFPVTYHYQGKARHIGELRLDASLSGVYSRLVSLCLVILITNAVKTFLVSFFILVLVRKKVINHLERIHSFLVKFEGENDLKLPGLDQQSRENEINRLADGINIMRRVIKDKIAIIEMHSEELSRKVREQTSELDRRNTEILNLLRTLSHDISNPLSIIMGRSDLALKLGPAEGTFRSKDWQKVRKASETMENIILMVRQLDEARNERFALSPEPVSVAKIFQNCEFLFEDKLRAKNVTLKFTGDEALKEAFVLAEPVSFSNQVINNLISNAIKFSYSGHNIYFHVSEEDKHLLIDIQDTGPGIPPRQQNRLFDPAYRTSRKGTGGEKGTGFGMLLVKSYVEKYGGSISVDSHWIEDHPEAHGTRVTLKLKKVRAANG